MSFLKSFYRGFAVAAGWVAPTAKRGRAPCGHPGEAVIGNYYRCLWGCDGAVPERVPPEQTEKICRHVASYTWSGVVWCVNCGKRLGG